jgi:regulator of protease activity HflC (stomatin/prohibitin superfamily)
MTTVFVIVFALIVAYLLVFSFGTVQSNEIATKLVFGKAKGDIEPGLYFAPPGIVRIERYPRTNFQDELPADPEHIFRKDDVEKIPPGMFPPIRVKFGQPDPTDLTLANDPYNIPMVAEVVPVVSWHITNATMFYMTIGSIENCRKIIQDKVVGVFGNKFSAITPAKASLHLGETSEELEGILKTETTTWGIEIDDAYVKPFVFSHSLNKSVTDVSEAKQKAKATIETAEATRQKTVKEGAGVAEARRLLLEAEAVGLEKLAAISKTPEGQLTLWMETMKNAFEKANYSIIPANDPFIGATAGISEALKRLKGEK